MKSKLAKSFGDRVFLVVDYILLFIVSLTCLLPVVHVAALSFSDTVSASTNSVLFLPKGFNMAAYETMFSNPIFLNSFFVSIFRTLVGTAINLVLA